MSQALPFTRLPPRISPRSGNTSQPITHLLRDACARTFTDIRALVTFPDRGHRRTDLTSRPLRFIRIRQYLIAYAPDKKPLWIIAVVHGRRDPDVLAAILKSRE